MLWRGISLIYPSSVFLWPWWSSFSAQGTWPHPQQFEIRKHTFLTFFKCEVHQSNYLFIFFHFREMVFGPQLWHRYTLKTTHNTLFTSDTGTMQVRSFEISKQPLISLITEFLTARSINLSSFHILRFNVHIPQSVDMFLSGLCFYI